MRVYSVVQLGSSETRLYKAIRDPIVEYGYLDGVTPSAAYHIKRHALETLSFMKLFHFSSYCNVLSFALNRDI
jgi:hypothetical protein